MPPHPLSVAVVRALDGLVEEGAVPWRGSRPDAEDADDARASRGGASYVTSLPLRVTGRTGIAAPQLAGLIVARLCSEEVVGSARVSGPGYVEIDSDLAALVRAAVTFEVVSAPGSTGALDPLAGGDPDPEVRHAVHEVGGDAVRFALARRTADAAPLDLELLGRADELNPGYAVQLAHARLTGVLRRAADVGVAPAEADEAEAELLREPRARALVALVAEAAPAAARALRLRRADLLARHLSATAEATHAHLSACPALPGGDEPPDRRHRARLRLARAARDAIAHGLDLLGVAATERM